MKRKEFKLLMENWNGFINEGEKVKSGKPDSSLYDNFIAQQGLSERIPVSAKQDIINFYKPVRRGKKIDDRNWYEWTGPFRGVGMREFFYLMASKAKNMDHARDKEMIPAYMDLLPIAKRERAKRYSEWSDKDFIEVIRSIDKGMFFPDLISKEELKNALDRRTSRRRRRRQEVDDRRKSNENEN